MAWLTAFMLVASTCSMLRSINAAGSCQLFSSTEDNIVLGILCESAGYNMTMLPPNETLANALGRLQAFRWFFNLNCHRHFRLLTCARFMPVCRSSPSLVAGSGKPDGLPPCREMCEEVQRECERKIAIEIANWKWFTDLNCSLFPSSASNSCVPSDSFPLGRLAVTHSAGQNTSPTFIPSLPSAGNSSIGRGRPCNDSYFFKASEKTFVTSWVAVWSVACLLSSSVTVLTFLMDRHRFNYPEKPIVCLSLSYTILSFAYLIRLFTGSSAIACSDTRLVDAGASSGPCTSVALLLYFSWMASYAWWLILTITWLLAAGLKWGYEAIAKHAQRYHLFGWGLPAAQTLVLVATESVDADELSRVCFVGNFRASSLLAFVIIPVVLYLFFGTMCILVGLVSLVRIRAAIKKGGKDTGKLDMLIVRIGILSAFYIGPASIVLGCYIYEYVDHSHWKVLCSISSLNCEPNCIGEACTSPVFSVFVLKYFMLLVVGVTSSVWIWSSKTVSSWRNFYNRLHTKVAQRRRAADSSTLHHSVVCAARNSQNHTMPQHSTTQV